MASSRASLPQQLVSLSDLKRVRRELEAVDDYLRQAGLRQNAIRDGSGKAVPLPQTSRLLDAMVDETGANLLHASDRASLLKYVHELIEHAPQLHISFASEPSAAFLSKLVIWLRANIHPQTVVQVGLQPAIAAGCIVRTANRQFDFSLAQAFASQQGLLVQSLQEMLNAPAGPSEAAEPPKDKDAQTPKASKPAAAAPAAAPTTHKPAAKIGASA